MGLSDVQKKINTDFGIVLTYMDVRFLVDDLDLTLIDPEQPVTKRLTTSSADDLLDEDAWVGGGAQIEVDGLPRLEQWQVDQLDSRMANRRNGPSINLEDLR